MPCASDLEYNFVRSLLRTPGAIPDDVTIQAITPCRKDLIQKTVNSLQGAKNAIIFSYISVSDNYRQTMLRLSEDECIERVHDCVTFTRNITKDAPNNCTNWTFGLGCEDAGDARPDFLLRMCETVKTAWEPTTEKPLIFGLATSVEYYMPNIFADQVEHFLNRIPDREKIRLSVHPHNDRGTAVAAAELSCLAGADMVEGCLFGNGERAGNVDLVTLALNCYRQGIDPGLDFANLPAIRTSIEGITKIPVHKRAPYAGDFAFLALSGTHQDAIRKGFAKRDETDMELPGISYDGRLNASSKRQRTVWEVPYLPMDPADLGITSANVIGINSQSGKAGISWILMNVLGLSPPDGLSRDFCNLVKRKSMDSNRDFNAEELCTLFLDTYQEKRFTERAVWVLRNKIASEDRSIDTLLMDGLVAKDAHERVCGSSSARNDLTLSAATQRLSQFLGSTLKCLEHNAQPLKNPPEVVAYVQMGIEANVEARWGVGIGAGLSGAYVTAILSSILVNLSLVKRVEC